MKIFELVGATAPFDYAKFPSLKGSNNLAKGLARFDPSSCGGASFEQPAAALLARAGLGKFSCHALHLQGRLS